MKLLFLGVFNKESTNYSQAQAFERLGCNVLRSHFRTYLKNGSDFMCKNIWKQINEYNPEFVLFSKCNEIPKILVEKIIKKTKTVMWYMDPLNKQYTSSTLDKFKICDLNFIALEEPFLKTKKISPNNTFFLQEGFDPLVDKPMDVKQIYEVSFIGNLRNPIRREYFNDIGFKHINNAYHTEHALKVSSTKINLNFTDGGTSDRTYKILAAKGFLLTQPWKNMERDFIIGKDLDIFTNKEDLKNKIKFYLNNPIKRLEIAEHGYKTVQKFSRDSWAKTILDKVKEL